MFLFIGVNAQVTADQVLDNYFENTGGKANWEKLEGIKITGKSNGQGMEIPVEVVQLKKGKQYVKISIQGKELMQGVYNGNVLWNTNFMTQKPEEMPTEFTENFKKNEANDFPTPFLNYKDKGYKAENLGEEIMEGTTCFKLKLTQNPVMVDGKEEETISFHYFDKESFVLIASESEIKAGPMKGQMMKSTMSDYDEVEGLYFPFSMTNMGMPMTIERIELNPTIEDSVFEMPKEEVTEEKVENNVNTPPPPPQKK